MLRRHFFVAAVGVLLRAQRISPGFISVALQQAE